MALVLVNPHAQGGRVRRRLPAIVQALQSLTPLPRWQAPETLEEALDVLLHEPEGARVVLVGGDGTVNRYLPALLLRRLQMGLVPLGSGNDLARALGLNRRDWRAALADALHGRARPMDTGLVVWSDARGDAHRTPFASSLTCGFDAAVGRRALLGPRWLSGLPRYLWATLAECRALQHYRAQGEVDGQPLPPGPWLFSSVLNTPTYGSGLPATPEARIDDGWLNGLHAGPFGRLGTLRMLPTLMRGQHLRHPLVRTQTLRELVLTGESPLPLAADGEWLGHAQQLRVSVQAASLPVVRPEHLQG